MLNKGAGDFPDQIYDFHENGTTLKSVAIRGSRTGSVSGASWARSSHN